ncbi:MAG: T9SS type A sorting domain-containing protein [candidate division Zixibacteria bacterium]|nr:T9SS type A sorting domain-containing protein [candidate division Zixibacteria bacterium]
MNRLHNKLLGIAFLLVLLAGSVGAQNPNLPVQYMTPYFAEFFDSLTTYNGAPVPVGSIVEAYDPTNLLIGKFRVRSAGQYGYMNAYGDDPNTPAIHEGAVAGNAIHFKINGRAATVVSGDNTWTDKALKNVRLAASGTVAISGWEFPNDILGLPGDTMQFRVGVKNEGDGLDFYGAHLNMSIPDDGTQFGWKAIEPDSVVYANPGQMVYVYFSVRVADWSIDTVNNINWSIFSNLDPTKSVNGSFNIFMTVTDVNDRDDGLPNSFAVYQNYPNPFNPTTTISFNLPKAEVTSLEVYNVLGQLVRSQNLGLLPSGEHAVEFSADNLSSGVYFYRIVAEETSRARKMILMK